MSEFCCIKGHIMSSGQYWCPICGGRLHTMDGMTGKQLRQQEDIEQFNEEDVDESDE